MTERSIGCGVAALLVAIACGSKDAEKSSDTPAPPAPAAPVAKAAPEPAATPAFAVDAGKPAPVGDRPPTKPQATNSRDTVDRPAASGPPKPRPGSKPRPEPKATGRIVGKVTAKKKKYLPNTVVYVEKAPGRFKPRKYEIGQKQSQFDPKLLVVLRGSTVEYTNSDPTDHSVYSPDGEKFDLGTWGKGGSRTRKYDKLGAYTQLCKLHPMMVAYVVVVQNPYFAVTKASGSFEITGVPAGRYTLRVWNARRSADPVEVDVTADADTIVTIGLHR